MEETRKDPSAIAPLADEPRRPIGVAILSVLAAIMGFVLLAASVVLLMLWQENNDIAISRRQSPSIFWFSTGLSVVLAFAASIGIWLGRKWGWWIACVGLVLFVIQNIGSAVMANLSGGAPSIATFLSVDSLKFVVRGIIFLGILSYWLRTRVRQYFHVEKTSRIKAVALSAVCGIGIAVLMTVVLQTIFLLRTR